jgi:hypothetical protein
MEHRELAIYLVVFIRVDPWLGGASKVRRLAQADGVVGEVG